MQMRDMIYGVVLGVFLAVPLTFFGTARVYHDDSKDKIKALDELSAKFYTMYTEERRLRKKDVEDYNELIKRYNSLVDEFNTSNKTN